MKIISETSLADFTFWSGAETTAQRIWEEKGRALKNICEAQKHITVRIKSGLLRVFLGKWLSCVPSTAFPMMKICSST